MRQLLIAECGKKRWWRDLRQMVVSWGRGNEGGKKGSAKKRKR